MNVWIYGTSGLIVQAVATMLRGYQVDVWTDSAPPSATDAGLWVAEPFPNDAPPRPGIPTLVLIDADGDVLVELLARGYRGYVSTNAQPQQLKEALRAVATGAIWASREVLAEAFSSITALPGPYAMPTPREREVLALISMALSNRAIAKRLGITERTVKAHVSSLLTKYQVRSRVELAINAGADKRRSGRRRDRAA